MKRKWLVIVALVLAAATWMCRGIETAPKTARITPDSCTAALAAGDSRDEGDRKIAELQDQARGGSGRKLALEQLGYRYVARARVRNDAGDYTLAEQTAGCLTSMYP